MGALSGSHPSDQAPAGLGASRFDPERVEEMLNAVRAQTAREMYEHLTKWEPIETAPRDKVILCAWPPLGGGDDPSHWLLHVARWKRSKGFCPANSSARNLCQQPTHWKELPSPPRDSGRLPKGENAEGG
jgi:hypothetical protein